MIYFLGDEARLDTGRKVGRLFRMLGDRLDWSEMVTVRMMRRRRIQDEFWS